MYVVYDLMPDGKTGRIQQTIVGPGNDYGENYLDPKGYKWFFLAGAMSLDPRNSYVDVETKSMRLFAAMFLQVDKTEFYANSEDFATVSGIPSGSTVSVYCNGQFQQSCIINDEQKIEIAADAAADYEVKVSCWTYNDASIMFKAIAPLTFGTGFSMTIPGAL